MHRDCRSEFQWSHSSERIHIFPCTHFSDADFETLSGQTSAYLKKDRPQVCLCTHWCPPSRIFLVLSRALRRRCIDTPIDDVQSAHRSSRSHTNRTQFSVDYRMTSNINHSISNLIQYLMKYDMYIFFNLLLIVFNKFLFLCDTFGLKPAIRVYFCM